MIGNLQSWIHYTLNIESRVTCYFYVIVVNTLMTLFINKSISLVKDDWNLDEPHATYGNTTWFVLHPQGNVVPGDWNLDEKSLSDNTCNIVESSMSEFLWKGASTVGVLFLGV